MTDFFDKCKIQFLIETCRMEDISDDEYFSEKYKHFVSNSKISLINPKQGGSPQKYRDGIKQSYNSSFEFGSAVHAILLQGDKFVLSDYIKKPSAKLGVFIDHIIKHRKKGLSIYESMDRASVTADYYSKKLTPKIIRKALESGLDYYYQVVFNGLLNKVDGKEVIVLPEKTLYAVQECIKSVKNTNKARLALYGNNFLDTVEFLNEIALFIDIVVTLPDETQVIVPFKLKIDNATIDPEIKTAFLNDLKTTGKSVNYFMGGFIDKSDDNPEGSWINGSFQNFSYYRQMGVYMMIFQMYCKTLGYEGYKFKSNMIVVESQNPHNCKVFPVNSSYIKEGLAEFKELICRVAWHETNGYDKELIDGEGNII